MLTFKQFLSENITFDTSSIDPAAKAEGRKSIERVAGFTDEQVSKMHAYFKKATADNIKSHFNAFVATFPKEAKLISLNKGPQVGPGEMVFYYVFDNIGVGGNQNIDLFLNGKPHAEVKGQLDDIEVSPGGSKAVNDLLKDLEAFNDAYKDENGEDLPEWKGAGDVKATTLRKWKDISVAGGGIRLTMKSDGDVTKTGDTDVILNVKKDKSTAPLKKVLDDTDETETTSDTPSSIADIEEKWAEAVANSYFKDKLVYLLDKKTLKIVYAGNVTSDILSLKRTSRGRPKADIILSGKKTETQDESE